MSDTIELRLKGSRRSYFPLVNIVLELLLNDPADYLIEPDLYIILFAALMQAWLISRWGYGDRLQPLIGNRLLLKAG